jgi:hypothetical protein
MPRSRPEAEQGVSRELDPLTTLTTDGFRALLAALVVPAEPIAALRQAFERHADEVDRLPSFGDTHRPRTLCDPAPVLAHPSA